MSEDTQATPAPEGETPAPDSQTDATEQTTAAEGVSSPEPSFDPAAWRDLIKDPDLRKEAERTPDLETAFKRIRDLRAKQSKAILVPDENASEEDWKAFREKMGIPDSPDAYEFQLPEGHEPTEADKAFQAKMAEAFIGANLSKEQAAKLNEAWNAYTQEIVEAQKRADQEFARQAEETLRKKWPGEEFDRNVTFAKRAVKEFAGEAYEELKTLETKDGRFVLDHPLVLEMFASVGREMGEDRLGPVVSDSDRTALQERINEVRQKRNEALSRNDQAMAQEYDRQALELYKKLNGNAPAVGTAGRTY